MNLFRRSPWVAAVLTDASSCGVVTSRTPFLPSSARIPGRWSGATRDAPQQSHNPLLIIPRGGSDEGVTLHGTTKPAESLYLPGILVTSIQRGSGKVCAACWECRETLL